MKDGIKRLSGLKNIGIAFICCYLHFITEVLCFYYLTKATRGVLNAWMIPFVYDGLAFVPQGIIGYAADKRPGLALSIPGFMLMLVSLSVFGFTSVNIYVSLILMCLGNALVHVDGAEATLKNSFGKLSHSAIFVSGGSFGVITGRVLALYDVPVWFVLLMGISAAPFIAASFGYKGTKVAEAEGFDYVRTGIYPLFAAAAAVAVVIIRGYMGYGIPTSWNKTLIQSVYMFVIMGLGKALGGILSDAFGIRKVAFASTLLAIPFLCLGDGYMFVSLIGVMFFSMTMSVTLAILVSVMSDSPGLAFGLTTIGLFLGTAPIFFVRLARGADIAFISVMSAVCSLLLTLVLKEPET